MNQLSRIYKNEGLRKRLIVLLIALSIFKVGMFIPAPFVNADAIRFGAEDGTALFNILTGGALSAFSIFAIGIMPYITASIIVMLLQTNVVPILMEWSEQGAHGQKKLKKLTYGLTLILALLQSVGISLGFDRLYGMVNEPTWWKFALISLVLTSGTVILVLLGEWIERRGIGKGISMIILAGIIMGLPKQIAFYYETNIAGTQENLFINIVVAILVVLAVYLLLLFTIFGNGSQRKIPMLHTMQSKAPQYALKADRNFFPIAVITTGVIPVIFASALFSLPMLINELIDVKWHAKMTEWFFNFNSVGGIIVYALFVYIFSVFYALVQLNPKTIATNLHESNLYIPTVRAGKETEIYLEGTIKHLSKIGGFLLVAIATLPMIAALIFKLPQGFAFIGTSLLITVSVAVAFSQQVQQEVQRSSYYGFMSNHEQEKKKESDTDTPVTK